MTEKTLTILEYNKIANRLSGFAVCEAAKQQAISLRPKTGLQEIAALQRETSDAVTRLIKCTSPSFDRLTDVSGALKRAEIGSVLRINEILLLGRILQSARVVKGTQGEQDDSLVGYFQALVGDKPFEDSIFGSFLGEDEVADNASPALFNIRRQIRMASDRVKGILNDMIRSSKYQKLLQDPIVTMRAGRHVIPVRSEYRADVPGMIHDTSASGATLFIEPMAVVNENNKIRELELKEKDEIERILAQFTTEIALRQEMISLDYQMLVNLDFIFAKAKMSLAMNAVSPTIHLEGETVLRKARHPLLDQKTVVPVDISLGEGALIITGPNTGGKTVVLKTIGLLTAMTQAGMHIPASEQSSLRICKKLFADIGDEQSIEQSLSTFSAHMKNIVTITQQADRDSLVLFDELGAGTDPVEGAALAISIIETVRSTGARVAATTHYSELKVYAMTTKGVQNASCEFDVETLQPTYRLLMGIPGKSNAFAISEKLGLSKKIVDLAKQKLSEETVKFEEVLSQAEESRKRAEKEAAEAAQLRREIGLIRNTVTKEQETVSAKAEQILEKARQEARDIVLNAKRQSEEVLEEVKELHKQAGQAGLQKKLVEVKTRLNESVKQTQKVSSPVRAKGVQPKDLKIGTTVVVADLDQDATVLALPSSDGKVLVQVGLMKMHVELARLSLKESQPMVTQGGVTRRATGGIKRSQVTPSTELDVRGMPLDDAVLEVERFIDNAVLASLQQVTIIHGKGTGVLRAGIAQLLKQDKRIASYRLGRYGEGESGVTICELK